MAGLWSRYSAYIAVCFKTFVFSSLNGSFPLINKMVNLFVSKEDNASQPVKILWNEPNTFSNVETLKASVVKSSMNIEEQTLSSAMSDAEIAASSEEYFSINA